MGVCGCIHGPGRNGCQACGAPPVEGYGWADKNGGYTTTITNNRTTVKKPEKIVRVPAMRVEEV